MSTLIVPPIEANEHRSWPSLGDDVVDWMEDSLVFGPGDLLNKPYALDDEDRALVQRAYQVYPPQHAGACRFVDGRCEKGGICGRRRFDTVVTMTRKGTLKSERLAGICAAELAEDAPVRCDGFRRQGSVWVPVGRPVTSPFVFLFAFAKEQAEDTSWDALRQMILGGPAHDRFSVWEDRILRRDGTGEAKPMATAPDSKDGGKTTFQGKEEGHRWTLPRQIEAHHTTVGNLSKRPIAQPWELHATTMYAPGEGSIIETLHEGVLKLTPEASRKSRLFFFYRWADEKIRIRTEDGELDPDAIRRAVIDASGPIKAQWSDIDGIVSRQFLAADADVEYAERVWLNRKRKKLAAAFDPDRWKALARPGQVVAPKAQIALGFDGARVDDWAALIATELATGHQWPVGIWNPEHYGGEIPEDVVDVALDKAMATFTVVRMYADPPYWKDALVRWQGQYGDKVVFPWETWRSRQMGFAVRNYVTAMTSGAVSHDGDAVFAMAIGNCHRRELTERDERGERLWTVAKERKGSPQKIDPAVAAILSWEARAGAIAAGAIAKKTRRGPAFASF